MRPQHAYQILLRAALVSCSLSSASFLNACGVLAPPDAGQPQPPQAVRPCDLPYREKAGELPAQVDLDKPLDGPGWSALEASDATAYNQLFPKFNANQDWAAEHCIAKPTAAAPDNK